VVAVSSLEAAFAERCGLDPLEVIDAANLDYPRPDVFKPGYVGGGALSTDPYLMINSTALSGAARQLNEYLPVHVATNVVELIRQERGETSMPGWRYWAGPTRAGQPSMACRRRRRDDSAKVDHRTSQCCCWRQP
jgi:UDP-N-acetyl-D-mannosaminuronic acid dehydrogenase